MHFGIIFALLLATAAAFDLRATATQSSNVVSSVLAAEGRITNGHKATVGQFPYQVGLSLKLNSYSSSWCGGSLIAKNWILTAAHCTQGVQSATVFLGATARTLAEVVYIVSSSNIIIHPNWNRRTLKNDIALISIPSVKYSSKIQPVKLPAISRYYSTYAGERVIASGWGKISDAGSVSNDLQWARLGIITNNACARIYGSTITSSNICVATPGGVSTCQGDSGGPLVLESSKIQIGLTSFGAVVGCSRGYPAVFTRITSYLDWIQTHTGIL